MARLFRPLTAMTKVWKASKLGLVAPTLLVLLFVGVACEPPPLGETPSAPVMVTVPPEPTAVPTPTRVPPVSAASNVVIAIPNEPDSLDPHVTIAPSSLQITRNIYDTLVRMDEHGAVQPGLAERWEAADSGRAWTFYLKRDSVFQNGRGVVGDDIAYSIERLISPDTASLRAKDYGIIDTITVSDTYTVTLHLKEPSGTLPLDMANEWAAIVPEEAAEGLTAHPVGTGPFQLHEWVRGNFVSLRRFDQNPEAPPPSVEEIVFRVMPDETERLAALRDGRVDIVTGLSLSLTQQLRNEPGITLVQSQANLVKVLALNHATPPFNDVRVRRAFCYAIDRQALIEAVWQGLAVPVGSELVPTTGYYSDLTARYPYNPDQAKALLGEAGYAQGMSVPLTVPPDEEYKRIASSIAGQLAMVGVQVQVQDVDWTVFLNRVYFGRDFAATVMTHQGKLDPAPALARYTTNSQWNYLGYHNPAYDSLMLEAMTGGEEERRKTFEALQRTLADDAVAVYLASPLTITAMRSNIVNCQAVPFGGCNLRLIRKE